MKHYYGLYSPYGNGAMSGGDTIHIFASRAARDAWVAADEWDGSNYHRQEIDSKYARRHKDLRREDHTA